MDSDNDYDYDDNDNSVSIIDLNDAEANVILLVRVGAFIVQPISWFWVCLRAKILSVTR